MIVFQTVCFGSRRLGCFAKGKCREAINDGTMSKNVSRIAPPKSSDAIQSGYPVIRAPNGIGKYVEISTDLKKCDYWMYALGAALAEKRKVNTNGTFHFISME
jgi:hypothetical protein